MDEREKDESVHDYRARIKRQLFDEMEERKVLALERIAVALEKLAGVVDLAASHGSGFGGEEIRVFRTENMGL